MISSVVIGEVPAAQADVARPIERSGCSSIDFPGGTHYKGTLLAL